MDEQQSPTPGGPDRAGGAGAWPPRWGRLLETLSSAPARRLIGVAFLVFVVAFGAYYAVLAHPGLRTSLGSELRRVEQAGGAALRHLRPQAQSGRVNGRTTAAEKGAKGLPERGTATGGASSRAAAAGGATPGAGAPASAGQGTAAAAPAAQEAAATAQPGAAANPAERKLLWPVSGPVIAGFGWGYSVTMHDWRWHDGIDVAAKVGTPVRAAAAGRVTSVSGDDQDGWTVRIAHVANVQTVYSGLERPLVKVGQTVEKGQVLGALGGGPLDEAAEAPHLHFAILASGQATDPINFLPPLP
ncbi:MAG: M23 family metallopeptidase [Firmicutes bacterium]|nr:M23 family metallopeptidase [Bacillota bacterium]